MTTSEYIAIVYPLVEKIPDLLLEGEKIKFPFGTFGILQYGNTGPGKITNINFNATMKRKKELIAEGKTPYEPIRDEDGNIIGDNGGEKYFQFFTEDSYFHLSIGDLRKLEIGEHRYRFNAFRSFMYKRRRRSKENQFIKIKFAA